MNRRFCKRLLTTALVTTGLGVTSSSYAEPIPAVNQGYQTKLPSEQQADKPTIAAPETMPVQPPEVVKVGYQPHKAIEAQAGIAKVYSYELGGNQATTLYVRSIPILTFLGSHPVASSGVKMEGSVANSALPIAQQNFSNASEDPARRAIAVADKLNQLSRNNVDAASIAVSWKAKCKCYAIKVNSEELVEINSKTILADTTNNLSTDALQATNRLRRLMGNAPPLRAIAGKPVEKPKQVALLPTVKYEIRGLASWYSFADNGSASASGEVFNQNALTAAHRSLPFGTRVRVTNLYNGRSVIVRINDRGPYIGGRVIDITSAAARIIGMTDSGVVPVRVDVLGPLQRQVAEN